MNDVAKLITECGKQMCESGLTSGTGGNISVFDRERGIMSITPSGIPYPEILEEQIMQIDVESGEIIAGKGTPSSETSLHRIFYQRRTDLNALVHTHSAFATAFSCLRKTLPAVHYLIAVAGIDVPCAEYASFGTVELAENVFAAMTERKACLMANHGLLAGGETLTEAYNVADTIEFCCRVYCHAKNYGEPRILDKEEMERMVLRFQSYGRQPTQS
ncbi:MAG TPA: L-fuculose-phosphate aldolase [Clostridiaceae bacterium]|nr:L-fuculose-phosphate aldolase [Clostridiaceae bacterium]